MHGSHRSDRPRPRDWLAGLTAGAVLGFILLGIGGRIGMRIIANELGQPGGFTVEGSLTVALLGAASGAIIALIFLLLRTALPAHRWLRGTLFWVICLAIALRGLRPVTVLNATTFLPLFLAHGILLHTFWCRIHLPRVRAAPSSPVQQGSLG